MTVSSPGPVADHETACARPELTPLARPGGTFAMVAMDQRASLLTMLAEARGTAGSAVGDDDLAAREAAEELSPLGPDLYKAQVPAAVAAACRGGASGFPAGRALWSDVLGSPDPETVLREISVPRLTALAEVVDRLARPWTDAVRSRPPGLTAAVSAAACSP